MNDAKNKSKNLPARLSVGLMYTLVLGTMWDIWWHMAIGRDSFWIPPHLLVYAMLSLVIFVSWREWYSNRKQTWLRLSIVLSLIPVFGFIDNLWHNFYGEEIQSSPFPYIIWSPPHVGAVLAILFSMALLAPIILKDKDKTARQIFYGMISGAILAGVMFFVMPFQIAGPYRIFIAHYLGLFSPAVVAAAFIGVLFLSEQWAQSFAPATMATIFFLILMSVVGMGQQSGAGLILSGNPKSPGWIITFAYLGAAVIFDSLRKFNALLRGAVTGAIWGGLLFVPAALIYEDIFSRFIADYGIIATVAVPILAATIGGAAISAILLIKSSVVRGAHPKHGL